MKPARPERIQDAHERDYITLCIGKLKKYKQMKQAMPELIIEIHKIMVINGTWLGFCKF
ncbi:MAG: hypothetical protein MI975_06495 [Cytophagales bacterium]|nr:hypothetical protein [Cytophagales bacterium]